MKALITGANGFIGTHLSRTLLARGEQVRAMVRRESAAGELRSLGAEIVFGDVTRRETLAAAVAGVDVVFHLAGLVKALSYEEMLAVNEQGTANVAEACAARDKPPVLLFVSSLAAGGPAPEDRPRTEADPPCPVSNYGRSKRAGELAAQRYAHRVPLTIVRPPVVFGDGDPNTLILMRPIANFGVLPVPGFERRKFSLIHVDDLVEALIRLAAEGRRVGASNDGEPSEGYYFVASDECPADEELGQMIAEAVGRKRVRLIRTPLWAGRWVGAMGDLVSKLRGRPAILGRDKIREATAGSWTCSAERVRNELGFHVAAPLRERLRQTADWYARQGWL